LPLPLDEDWTISTSLRAIQHYLSSLFENLDKDVSKLAATLLRQRYQEDLFDLGQKEFVLEIEEIDDNDRRKAIQYGKHAAIQFEIEVRSLPSSSLDLSLADMGNLFTTTADEIDQSIFHNCFDQFDEIESIMAIKIADYVEDISYFVSGIDIVEGSLTQAQQVRNSLELSSSNGCIALMLLFQFD
jgi:hypothetical protein